MTSKSVIYRGKQLSTNAKWWIADDQKIVEPQLPYSYNALNSVIGFTGDVSSNNFRERRRQVSIPDDAIVVEMQYAVNIFGQKYYSIYVDKLNLLDCWIEPNYPNQLFVSFTHRVPSCKILDTKDFVGKTYYTGTNITQSQLPTETDLGCCALDECVWGYIIGDDQLITKWEQRKHVSIYEVSIPNDAIVIDVSAYGFEFPLYTNKVEVVKRIK